MNSLTKIKQIINSMESQIKDEDVSEFQRQITDLESELADNAPASSFVKMMQSIGNYLASETNNAHKETVPVLVLLTEQLDTLVEHPDTSPEKTHEILAQAIQSFKTLKAGIYDTPLLSKKEIESLKSVILSIDWEISDNTLNSFDTVVNQLIVRFKFHKIHFSFLKMFHSIGGYVARNKANAHGDSLSLLRSIFQNYEKILQNPDMTFAAKKQTLELAIKEFQEFKRKIARPEKALSVQNSTEDDSMEDDSMEDDSTEDDSMEDDSMKDDSMEDDSTEEEMMPALSHVKFSSSTGDLVPLSKLPDQDPNQEISRSEISLAEDEITPALAGKKKPKYDSRDMMDDLFTAKESPTDELLDAIHLSELQGPGQEYGAGIFGIEKDQNQKEGVKNFIPQRMNKEPIPEIESRLDEFFDLTDPKNKIKDLNRNTGLTRDDEPISGPSPGVSSPVTAPLAANEYPDLPDADEEQAEAIVPFEYEDESFMEDETDQPGTILQRLKASLKTPDRIADPPVLSDFMKDLSLLREKSTDDWEKVLLVEMLISLAEYTYNPEKDNLFESPINTETPKDTETQNTSTDSAKPPVKGIWAKIKSMFTI